MDSITRVDLSRCRKCEPDCAIAPEVDLLRVVWPSPWETLRVDAPGIGHFHKLQALLHMTCHCGHAWLQRITLPCPCPEDS